MARVLSYLIRNFNNYYTLHRSDLAAQAAPLDPRLISFPLNIEVRFSKLIVKIAVLAQYDILHWFSYSLNIIPKKRTSLVLALQAWFDHVFSAFKYSSLLSRTYACIQRCTKSTVEVQNDHVHSLFSKEHSPTHRCIVLLDLRTVV